ncbi:TonB-dependent siderophore receptor [Comamonas endophytica]|uniref:TonB-dependent siderophore receptor n=1 Tax=Comamonas endophytica TaxID=2949090 RepID=A0ABY6G8D8_9BURK|nr:MULTISPECIES: TonB-dependent siderophore receptor [unclassified Acidovorax]MCD2511239.1 TonB-dependent siderophore receptor [Acidovorax sp. D4N7]UYG50635.1 TonB-dependent siderophore receptor [Acidovorax sp. 5MLIR]
MSRFRFHPAPLAVAVALLAAVPAQAQSGAAPASIEFRIAAQPLAQALDALARQARLELMVQPALVEGKSAPAVQGQLTASEALNRLLAGSGLYAEIDGSAVLVRRVPQGSATLAPVTVSALAARSAVTEHTGSYTTPAVTLGRGTQAIKDIPQSVSVVTRQLMDDQNLKSVYDVLASTTGITLAQSPQGGKYIYSRGFDLTTVQYDGVPLNRGIYGRASNFSSNMASIDRAEVLRGAAGLLQGEGSPGGAVNLVRKRPLDGNAMTAELRAGSWDRYGAQLDISRVLNEEGTLRGRALIDHEDQHSFIDYVNRRNTAVYGTLEYDLSPATRINVAASAEEIHGRPFLNGLPRSTTGGDLGLPRSTYFGATWNRQESSHRGLHFDVSHQFDDDWKLLVSGLYLTEDHDMKYAGVNRAVNPALGQSANIVARSLADLETSGIDAHLTGRFDAYGRRHELVSGMNYTRTTNDTTYGFRTNYNIFNIGSYDPALREPLDSEIYSATREDRKGNARQLGFYNALRLQLSDPLKLVVGARVSWFRTDWDTVTTGAAPSTGTTRARNNAKINPYAGLIYALDPQWSAYVSYADIFKPQNELDASGALLRPMVGANYEAGLKGELMQGRLNTSLALFRIEQKHRAQVDYGSSPTCRDDFYCYTDSGKVRSQGLDAEISGEVARGWNLFAGYTFVRSKYVKDVDNEGLAFQTQTPKHLLRLWSTYQLPGELNAFTLGGGVNAQSASYQQVGAARALNGGRAVWSALLKYRIDRNWTAALNVNNLFDKRYYSSSTTLVNGNYYGDPRNVMLTLRGAF